MGLGSLVSSSDREKRHKFELSSLEKESHKEIQHEFVEKITKKALNFFRLQRKQTPFFLGAFGELDPHIWGGVRPKKVRGAKTDVRQAAHLLLFVVRWSDFSGKWCTT